MLNLFIFLLIVFATSFITCLCIKKSKLNSKTNIYAYGVKDYSDINFNLLYLITLRYLRKDFKLVIIQDDIKFRSSNFYWPKNTVYIHMSDAINIGSNNFISDLHSKSNEEIVALLKSKVYIT